VWSQNCSSYTSCISCAQVTSGGSAACFWCVPVESPQSLYGCNNLQNGQVPAGVCQMQDDSYYTFTQIGACPDNPCKGVESNECNRCLTTSGCGWCVTTSLCELGSSSGPVSNDCANPPLNWRTTTSQTCIAYQSCASITGCGTCASTNQDANTPCAWCGSYSNGTCSSTPTCGSAAITNYNQCPSQPNSSSTFSFSFFLFSSFLLVFIALL